MFKCQETMTIQEEVYYLYHQTYHKLTGIDLRRQTNTTIPQKSNIAWKLEEENGTLIIFIP